MSFFREHTLNIHQMCPNISPLKTPGEWQQLGGINRWRLRGLVCREVSNLPFLIQIFISRKMALLDLSEKVQDTPHLFMVDWNSSQYCWSTTGSGWCFHTANPSSMYLLINGRKISSSGDRLSFSKRPRNRLAFAVAGPVPVKEV